MSSNVEYKPTITANVIKDSINPYGSRIVTFELEYPRLVHAEVMTHRVFSRNAASSRAIPIKSVIQQVIDNPAMPFKWGKNRAGMQATENLEGNDEESAKLVWLAARDQAVSHARILDSLGCHKQVVNRILEPFQHIKVVLTTTEYGNWKWLRLHPDADPTIAELARVMDEAVKDSTPEKLSDGMWHLPYVDSVIKGSTQIFYDEDGDEISQESAIKISCSSCAQVSYRKLNKSQEKAEDIYKKLVESEPVHASAFEHCAKVLEESDVTTDGVTHFALPSVDFKATNEIDSIRRFLWSGNFRGGWIQYRQLIKNNAKKDNPDYW